jgi:hypothetical protein
MTHDKDIKPHAHHVVQDERSSKSKPKKGRFYQAVESEPRTAWERDNAGKPGWNTVRRNVSGFWHNLRKH